MLVLAITPLIFVVMTPALALTVLELIIEDVDIIPLTSEVKVLMADISKLAFIKFAVVVAVTPLTTEVRVKLFVLVDTLSV